MMDGQIGIFDYLKSQETDRKTQHERLKVGDRVGRIILGEIEIGTINKVEGYGEYFFYRTDHGCFDAGSRTDIEQMEREAAEARKKYKTIEIDHFDKFYAVEYPPRNCDGVVTKAMVGIFQGMLFWKEDCTYQFLEPCENVEKEYQKRIYRITHNTHGEELRYTVLQEPIKTNRLYWSNARKCYADARYVEYNY